jgi:hypothetical protein
MKILIQIKYEGASTIRIRKIKIYIGIIKRIVEESVSQALSFLLVRFHANDKYFPTEMAGKIIYSLPKI